MSPRPHPASRSLRERPTLVAAVAFASVTTVLALLLIVTGSEPDIASVVFYGVAPILFTSVGVVVLVQLPGHGVGRLSLAIGLVLALGASLMLLVALVDPAGPVTVILPGPAGTLLEIAVGLASALPAIALFVGGAILVVWFPDGRPRSRLGRASQAVVIVAIAGAALAALQDPVMRAVGYTPTLESLFASAFTLVFGGLAAAYLLAIADLANRYRSADPVRQTQMRWVLAAVLVELVLTVLASLLSEQIGWLWAVWIASTVLPIVAVAVAITRYHLYDIDRIISRSLTYIVLTAVLFVAFAAVNLVLQQMISPFTGRNAIATAASTLVVAALFNPARTRIQAVVDRRFHRARYDAERTVQGFASRLRDEVDLPTLVAELDRVAMDAVEPSTTTVWLRQPEPGQ